MKHFSPVSGSKDLHALVAEALDGVEQRGNAALEELCAQHPAQADELRRRVHGLAAMGLLDEAGAASPEALPGRLGDFVPVRRLGGGGMGVVYLARQESLGREVALKLVRPDQLYFPGARERFQREVETVARLQHPGIVPVYAVGEERGIPYLAMEHIQGRNLADVITALAECDPGQLTAVDLARAVGGDAVGSSWVFTGSYEEACVRIVRQAAEALEHAHKRGVLHRDIKPSNLMVTPDGRALLLDFGLASREGSTKLTRTGSQLGSLAYMAPELFESGQREVGARADIYGLGVTLYELLALRSPFASDSAEATRIAVLSGDPPSLAARNRSVAWELETVCMKAMDADPARRYASAADFARDLENVLEQRPIEARRAGAWLRARRWVQRHPTASVAVLAGVLVLLVGPSVFAVQQGRARARLQLALDETEAERERATALAADLRVQRDEAQAQNSRAEQNLEAALSAVDVMLTHVGDRSLSQVPQMDGVRRALLEDALAFYSDLLAQREGEATSLDELGLRLKLAQLEIEFGEDATAEARLADLLERIERAPLPRGPDDDLTYLRGRVLNAIAGLRYYGPTSAEAIEEFRTAVRILKECATGPQATSGRRTTAAIAMANLGKVLWQDERPREQVLEVYNAAREIRLQLLGEDSQHVNQRLELAYIDNLRARCLVELGRLDESRLVVEQAVGGLRAVLEESPAGRAVRRTIVTTANALADSLDFQGYVEQSVALKEDVLPVSEALMRDFPDFDEYFQNGMVLATGLAGGLSDLGRLAESRDLLRRSLADMDRRAECYGEAAGQVLMAAVGRTNLAEVLLDLNEPAAALIEVNRAITEQQDRSQTGGPGTALRERANNLGSSHVVRATVLAHQGVHEQARGDLLRAEPSQAGDARSEYELAKAWMLCGAAVEKDAALSDDARVAQFEECYARSLAALARAVDAGWTNSDPLHKDALWEPLRGLPEFDALLERLQPKS